MGGILTTQPLRRSDREEFWNFLTHFTGFILSVAGLFWLVSQYRDRELSVLLSIGIFGMLLIAVYASSAMSHLVRTPARLSLFRNLDQAFIYLLIVASYSPFSIAYQSSSIWFNVVLALMWILAVAGFASKMFGHRVESVAIWMYLLLGWIPFISGMPFAGLVPMRAIVMIILGGVFYTAGTWFLYKDKSVWYFHAIWHLFVILGSVTHFVAVCWYV